MMPLCACLYLDPEDLRALIPRHTNTIDFLAISTLNTADLHFNTKINIRHVTPKNILNNIYSDNSRNAGN
jgi:hypothetical protein